MNGYRALIRRLREHGWDDGARVESARVPPVRKREIEDEIHALQAWAKAIEKLSHVRAERDR